MLFMNHKRTYKVPHEDTESSSWNFANLGSSAIYAAVHTFLSEANFFESANHFFDERPKRVASRLVQLCDDFDKEFTPMLIMDYKSPNKLPWHDAKSSPKTIFNFVDTCASICSNKADFFETNYVVDERPNRVASRLVQLCDEFDEEFSPPDCHFCHILSLLLSLLCWLIWS